MGWWRRRKIRKNLNKALKLVAPNTNLPGTEGLSDFYKNALEGLKKEKPGRRF